LKKFPIQTVRGRQILDSRGRPTVEAEVELADGTRGRASVPSGASTGAAEAHELRDGAEDFYEGRGVLRAVAHVGGEIAEALRGRDALEQRGVDELLVALDGTEKLTRLGANAVLAVSLAACRASARALKVPLYHRIAALYGPEEVSIPLPMVNILSGGLHAGRGMDVQDFLFIPARARTVAEAIEQAARVRTAADRVARERGMPTLLADEGGVSPGFETAREALEMFVECIERAGLAPGEDAFIAVDVAASTLWEGASRYHFEREGRDYTGPELIELVEAWARDFPVISVEDALGEEEWQDWKLLTERLGGSLQLIGDDLFTTNLGRVRRGVGEGVANGVLVKLNQNGTLTGTLDVMREARAHGYATVISARSGETDDSFIADLAVGTSAGQIKIGSLRCSERLSKYNQLLRIEELSRAPFSGTSALAWGRGKGG
jgi:enolase